MVPTFFLCRLPSVRKSSKTALSMYSSSWEGREGGKGEREGGREGGRRGGGRKRKDDSGDVDRQQKVVSHTAKFSPH